MIYDLGTETTLSVPNDAAVISFSDGVDLTDGSDGIAALMSGDQLYYRCEVTTAFTVEAGTPLAQFGVAIGTTDPLTANNCIVLGMTGGNPDGTSLCGIPAADLPLGALFDIPIPHWSSILNASGALSVDTLHTYKYLGLVLQNTAGTPASNDFATGTIKARIVHRQGGIDPLDFLVGSRMTVK